MDDERNPRRKHTALTGVCIGRRCPAASPRLEGLGQVMGEWTSMEMARRQFILPSVGCESRPTAKTVILSRNPQHLTAISCCLLWICMICPWLAHANDGDNHLLRRMRELRTNIPEADVYRIGDEISMSLVSLQPEDIKDLMSCAESDDPFIVACAMNVIARKGRSTPQLLKVVEQGLSHADRTVQAHAVFALQNLEPADRRVVSAAAQALLVASRHEVFDAVEILEHLGRIQEADIDAVCRASATKHSIGRRTIALLLPRMANYNAIVIKTLRELLRDQDRDVRIAAIRSAGVLGKSANDVVPDLCLLAIEENSAVATASLIALGRIGHNPPGVLQAALTVLQGSTRSTPELSAALFLLANSSPSSGKHREYVTPFLQHSNVNVRCWARNAITPRFPELAGFMVDVGRHRLFVSRKRQAVFSAGLVSNLTTRHLELTIVQGNCVPAIDPSDFTVELQVGQTQQYARAIIRREPESTHFKVDKLLLEEEQEFVVHRDPAAHFPDLGGLTTKRIPFRYDADSGSFPRSARLTFKTSVITLSVAPPHDSPDQANVLSQLDYSLLLWDARR